MRQVSGIDLIEMYVHIIESSPDYELFLLPWVLNVCFWHTWVHDKRIFKEMVAYSEKIGHKSSKARRKSQTSYPEFDERRTQPVKYI